MLSEGLMFLFTKIPNLAGIKEGIPQINKDEIKEMILLRFKGLSLEEIDFAFKLERFGVYKDRTEHYQMFDASYVSEILNKYSKWRLETRQVNNIDFHKKMESKELSEQDKAVLVINGIIEAFEVYKNTGRIESGKSWIYDYYHEKRLLPFHNKVFREKIKRKAIKNLYKRQQATGDRDLKSTLKEIQNGSDRFKTECKYIVLKMFFGKLIAQKTDIRTTLK